ncbi:hypothetical protein [Paraburkholderia flagellata]|uniref:hypothetical protein n=1 Tax=Paraburkholderia flagellata TaxID=2883241 RepID=UPI001F1A8C9C|nr:hypothetical protein [Paraburkholderia flagellata]
MSCSRGAALRGTAEVEQAIDGTQRFGDTVLDCVSVGAERGASLKEWIIQTLETVQPIFGDWPVFRGGFCRSNVRLKAHSTAR